MKKFSTFIVALGIIIVLPLLFWPLLPLPQRAELIPTDYFQLREQFREKGEKARGRLESYVLEAVGPAGEPLTIDVLWLGSRKPKEVFLHISGTHGVEGYAGSSIQSALLQERTALPEDTAVVFLHALNPYGMAYRRRFNERNVDLNRNFLLSPDDFQGVSEAYVLIESFLNPETPPSKIDLFFPTALSLVARYGFTTLKQAVGGGQYEYPQGIYFGGFEMEASNRFLKDWAEANLFDVERLYVLEVHTGLGEWGKDVLFTDFDEQDARAKWFQQMLGEILVSDDPSEGVGFETRGDLQQGVAEVLPHTDVYWVLQEFGTYNPVLVLRALRNENAYHHTTSRTALSHWSKEELLEVFSPGDAQWQQQVISRGVELGKKFLSLLGRES